MEYLNLKKTLLDKVAYIICKILQLLASWLSIFHNTFETPHFTLSQHGQKHFKCTLKGCYTSSLV